ncbi:hypothetical protein [Actinomadura sp. 6N118]|uniref:hypothetical protein n=1 Tax=Actinomadura sp. 6N118 TaxID=3375151 RepID=UPI0037B200B7
MGSLLEELARREAAVRQRIEEIREQIADLESRLETEEDLLSRLAITRQMVEEIFGEAAHLAEERVGAAEPIEAAAGSGEASVGQAVPRGVMTVPPWRPGIGAGVLPQVYRDAVEIMADAGKAVRAGQILQAMGVADEAAKREGLRSKLKRLVERGWAREDGPGLFAVAEPVAREMGGRSAVPEDGIDTSPGG